MLYWTPVDWSFKKATIMRLSACIYPVYYLLHHLLTIFLILRLLPRGILIHLLITAPLRIQLTFISFKGNAYAANVTAAAEATSSCAGFQQKGFMLSFSFFKQKKGQGACSL
jgi:hypothetical protein